jgi:hypothetical protein
MGGKLDGCKLEFNKKQRTLQSKVSRQTWSLLTDYKGQLHLIGSFVS